MTNTKFVNISTVKIPDSYYNRITTGVESLDHLFDMGILPGETFSISGGWGTGKSQFVLQLLSRIQQAGKRVGLVSGEESLEQIESLILVADEQMIDKIKRAIKNYMLWTTYQIGFLFM